MQLAIINSSTVVSDAQGATIVDALNQVLPRFCSDWKLGHCIAIYVPRGKSSAIPLKIRLLDNADVPGALGYHDIAGSVPYGKCFANTVLQNGGVILYSENHTIPTFAQCVAHEAFELLLDPICNNWWDIGDGQTLYAAEVCDPVEKNTVVVTVPASMSTTAVNGTVVITNIPAQQVGLSDWILPAWADPQNTKGPYNHNNTLKKPFTLDVNGYGIQMVKGVVKPVFGSGISNEKKAAMSKNGRSTFARTI